MLGVWGRGGAGGRGRGGESQAADWFCMVRVWLEKKAYSERQCGACFWETSKVMNKTASDRRVWQTPKTLHLALVEATRVAGLLTCTSHFQ